MKKKLYLKPDVKVHQLKPQSIICGSTQAKENEQYQDGTEITGWE